MPTNPNTPNRFPVVQQVAAQFPHLLVTNTTASCFEFVCRCLAGMADDPNWGHVGKTAGESQAHPPNFPRPSDPQNLTGVSQDAIFHKATNQQVDLLGNSGANDGLPETAPGTPARIQWGLIPQENNRPNNPWVTAIPPVGGTLVPNPTPLPVVPGRGEALDELNWLDSYYAAPEGLQRPNGLSLNGKPDFEGVAAWYLDEYQQWRIAGKSRAEARAHVVNLIRHSDEWRIKHPGETP